VEAVEVVYLATALTAAAAAESHFLYPFRQPEPVAPQVAMVVFRVVRLEVVAQRQPILAAAAVGILAAIRTTHHTVD
jgi:hypothetical protein